MIPILSRAEMRAFDADAIARGVPGVVLMENAGRGAADVIARESGDPRGKRVVVVCGAGNNGGDGFVVARHMRVRGADVALFLAPGAKLAGDAKTNHDAWRAVGGTVGELSALPHALASCHVVVDALFGTGLDRPISGAHAEAIRAINDSGARCCALDIPSGLDCDTGKVHGVAVRAAYTATFAHHKLGLWTPRGAEHAGAIHLCDIGVPASAAESASAQLVEVSDVARMLVPRAISAHKNTAGHVAAFAGSHGKTGASILVARAALRAGAGLSTIVTWDDAIDAVEPRVLEVMTARIDSSAIERDVDTALAGKRAVVIGPGFGLDSRARTAIERVLARASVPVVIDADAITAFAGRPQELAQAKAAILTPHPAELGRLLGVGADVVESDRYGAARELAGKSRAVVVLKGARTIVASPDGRVCVNPSGNAALATAGSGDVLAGITGALACTLDPFDAAVTAVYLHGAAADMWARENGHAGLLAGEIADLLPRVRAALAREHTPCSV